MDPNGQGIQQNISQPDINYQFPRMPQMQNVVGQQVNAFVPGYNVMPPAQGAVVTNLQAGLPVSGFLSLGNSNGSGPLPSMGSFIASLNQPQQHVGIVQNVGKSGVENWTGSSPNSSTLPSFGHFLLPQQYQNQPQQTLIGAQTSVQQQIFPVSQQSPQQVFSPGQHSTQFFPAAQMSPQQQMFTANQHSPQQILVNNQGTAQFFPTQPSQQFFGPALQQQQVFTGHPAPQQIYTNTQPMFNPVPNRLPAGQLIGGDMLPQVITSPRMNYVAGVNNIVGNQMLPPINQLLSTSTGQVIPSIGNMLQGQPLPSFNNFVPPYVGQMNATGPTGNQVFLPTSISTCQVTSSVVTTMSSNPQLKDIHRESKSLMNRNTPQHSNVVTVSMTTSTVSHSRSTKKAKTSPSYSAVSRIPPKSSSIEDSRTCVVPFGWSRVVVDNAIIYYSPTNVPLKTPMEIAKYLTTDGTCKCGLECPVYINKVFNFDVGILSRMWTLDVDCPQDLTKLCNHKRKMIAMATFHSNFSLSSSQLPDTVSVNSISGGIPSAPAVVFNKTDVKKTSKPIGTKSVPVGGILVSDLMKEQELKEKSESMRRMSQGLPISISQPKSIGLDSTIYSSQNILPPTCATSQGCSSTTQGFQSSVLATSQGLHSSVSTTLHGLQSSVLATSLGLHNTVTTTSQGLHSSVSTTSQGLQSNVTTTSQGLHCNVTTTSQGLHSNVTTTSQGLQCSISTNSQECLSIPSTISKGLPSTCSIFTSLQGPHFVSSTTSQGLQSSPSTALQGLHYSPSTTKQGLISSPSTTPQGLISSPSTTSQGLISSPSTTSQGLISSPSTTSQGLISSPSTSSQGVISSPSTSSQGLISSPSTTSQGLISSPSTTSQGVISSPSTSSQGVISSPSTSSQGVISSPSVMTAGTSTIITSKDTASEGICVKENSGESGNQSVAMTTIIQKEDSNNDCKSEHVNTVSPQKQILGNQPKPESSVNKPNMQSDLVTMVTDQETNECQNMETDIAKMEVSTEEDAKTEHRHELNMEVDLSFNSKSKTDECLSTNNSKTDDCAISVKVSESSEMVKSKGQETIESENNESVNHENVQSKSQVTEPVLSEKQIVMDTCDSEMDVKKPNERSDALIDSPNISNDSTNDVDPNLTLKTESCRNENNESKECKMNETAASSMATPGDCPVVSAPLSTNGSLTVSPQTSLSENTVPVSSSLEATTTISSSLTSISTVSSHSTSCTTMTTSSSSVSKSESFESGKHATKLENRDLKISVASTIVTSIISSINAVRSHETVDKKKSPKSPKQHKGPSVQKSPKSPKPPGTYDSFPLFQMPQLRYPLNHLSPGSGSEVNPYDMNPFSGQYMPPGMFNFDPYSLLNDKWLDPKRTKKSPKSSKKDNPKSKVNSVYDSDTPPPNVDVSQLQDHGKGPIPKVSASFLDDPSAFLAEQSVLISSSLSTNLSSPTKDSHKSVVKDKNDTVDGDLKSSPVSSTTGARAVSSSMAIPYSLSTASHGMVVNSNASLNSKVGQSFSSKHWRDESHSILGCAESEMFTEDRCESLSPDSGYECPSANETITPSSIVHHTASQSVVEKKPESQLDKTVLQNNKILDILSNARKGFLPPCSVGTSKKISPQKGISNLPSSQSATKTFPSRSAIQQVLSNAKSNEFPASTLLSAAARAQMANQTMNYPMISQTSQNQFINPLTSSVSDTVSLVSSSKNTFLVSQPSALVSSSVKLSESATPKSDIVSGHESVVKLLRQPVNLNVPASLNKVSSINKLTDNIAITSTVLLSASKTVNSAATVSSTGSNNQPILPVSSVQSSYQNILPNLSALPANLGPPLLNIVANSSGISVLPGNQVLPESAGITQQYIHVPGQPFVSVDNSQGIPAVQTGTTQQLVNKALQPESQNMKPPVNNLVNMPKLHCVDQQQQPSTVANGQMLLMPNLQMPLLQYLGTNALPVNMGQDKTSLQPVCNPPDLQMINGQMQVNMPNMGAPFNVMNIQQQIWNNSGNLTAMQLHTLQLQQQLLQQIQQLQDMQSLISQFSLQTNNVPITTVANSRDDTMTTRENSVPGKATPETMVSIVSTTCQESPGNGEDGPGNSEDKGTSTDFDEDSADYVDQEMIENEFNTGVIADTTCSVSADNEESSCSQTDIIENTSISLKGENSNGASVDNIGAIDDSGVDLSVDVCHTNSEPVIYTSEDNLCITSSIGTPPKYLSSNDECIPEYSKSDQTKEKPAVKTRKAIKELAQKRKHGEDVGDELLDTLEMKGLNEFDIGDLVWGQIRGFPSWPGKVVHESEVYDAEELEPGKCWVKWFGDHTFTQVEMQKLKTLTEGLEGHQKSKKKNKKGRKMNSNLEAAIHEALIELDRQASMQVDNVAKKLKVK